MCSRSADRPLRELVFIYSCIFIFSEKRDLQGLAQMRRRWYSMYKETSDKLFNGVISIDLLNFGALNSTLSWNTAEKMGNQHLDIALKYHKNSENNMNICVPYHRSGDKFAVYCQFGDEESFKRLVKDLAHVIDEKEGIKCYGRCGAEYPLCSLKKLIDGFKQAKDVEKTVKSKIADEFGAADYAALKNILKDGEPLSLREDQMHIYYDIK